MKNLFVIVPLLFMSSLVQGKCLSEDLEDVKMEEVLDLAKYSTCNLQELQFLRLGLQSIIDTLSASRKEESKPKKAPESVITQTLVLAKIDSRLALAKASLALVLRELDRKLIRLADEPLEKPET